MEELKWSRKLCGQIANTTQIPIALWDPAAQRDLVTRFLKFYATGNTPNTHHPLDIILGMASLIFKNDPRFPDLIWDKTAATEDPKNASFSLEGRTPNVGSEEGPNPNIDDKKKSYKIITSGKNLYNYRQGSLKEFIVGCEKILMQSPANFTPTRKAISLYNLCNFLAMTMLRATTKTTEQMITGFLKSKYRQTVHSMVLSQLIPQVAYAPPSLKCIEVVCSHVKKTNPYVSTTIARIVYQWSSKDELNLDERLVNAAFLSHTAWYGMGILKMLLEVCEFYRRPWKDIHDVTLITSTQHTWEALLTFYATYFKKGSVDRTVCFARVIDDTYFSQFLPIDHVEFASLLMSSLDDAQGKTGGIYKAGWAVKHPQIVLIYRKASEWLRHELLYFNGNIVALFKESEELAKLVNEIGAKAKKEEETDITADLASLEFTNLSPVEAMHEKSLPIANFINETIALKKQMDKVTQDPNADIYAKLPMLHIS